MKPVALICGGTGYVGRHLAKYLQQKGFDAISIGHRTADLLNYSECENLLHHLQAPHWIFNLAADVGGIGHIQKHKAAGYCSATINTNLLRAIVNTKADIKGYFLSSSSCVYGEDPDTGFGPGRAYEGSAKFSTASEGYGQAKFFAEKTCLAFKQEFGVPVRIARYHAVYGPGENRPGKEHFIESLVKQMAAAEKSGVHEIKVWGTGEQQRSLLYIDDCVEGTFRIMSGDYSEPVNLAAPEPVTVNQVISTLEEIAGFKVARFYNKDAPVGVKKKTAEIDTLRTRFGWVPEIGTREGLEKTWAARNE